ncbi:MAG: hypothetical protein EA398_13175 [Deltaproteobacteria bacterium]|nr:MAG: hypothetical protein EA398_13175 [Deltaproteobacteria bacterium]
MILCREDILRKREDGHIVIEPFEEGLVGINSVDVRLGADLFRLRNDGFRDLYSDRPEQWEKVETVPAGRIRERHPSFVAPTLHDDDPCFILDSGGFYLATTLEAIGARALEGGAEDGQAIVPEMKARSTVGRQGLTVALCAGLGDVGYVSRWALEVRVVDCGAVAVAVGTPIAQVVFHYATPTHAAYDGASRYQHAGAVRFLPKPLKPWRPAST